MSESHLISYNRAMNCLALDCVDKSWALGYCASHWYRYKRYGDANVNLVKPRHGLTGSNEYWILNGIKQRCYNKNSGSYMRYGGRGIRVCERWLESVVNFVEDMGKRPSKAHSIDRIDNDGDYTPENCRWVTSTTQVNNRGINKNNSSGIKGVSYYRPTGKWRVSITINYKSYNLGYYATKEEAERVYRKAKERTL